MRRAIRVFLMRALQITDDAMDRLARAIGCPVEAMTFDPYPA